MRMLLVTNYWKPWNCPGTIRWLQLGRYLDFDVLTSKKPRKAFYDDTLPKVKDRIVYRHGWNFPAILSGLYLTWFALFHKYDIYVITIPPYTLSLCAWLLQKMGRKVVLDIRDNQDNKNNHWKLVAKLSSYFQSRVKHRTTCMRFMDEGATRILSGYNPEIHGECDYKLCWHFVNNDRRSYASWNWGIRYGYLQDYRDRINGKYNCSSFVNLLYLGFKNLPTDCLHNEVVNQPIQSWEESAKQMREYLDNI